MSDLAYNVRVVTVRQLIPPGLVKMVPGPELGALLAGIDSIRITHHGPPSPNAAVNNASSSLPR